MIFLGITNNNNNRGKKKKTEYVWERASEWVKNRERERELFFFKNNLFS